MSYRISMSEMNPLYGAWIPFGGASVGYFLSSMVVIATNHPMRWVIGLVVTYIATHLLLGLNDFKQVIRALNSVVTGEYGLGNALSGDLWSSLLWMGIGVVGVCIAAYYRGKT